mmetsp:Transcript_47486/g.110135  ORF Transcript_47486/g.110135 Transcript_47486/m.110135 type:complete len:186 (-) Transcript_47486:165-722(-)
MSCGFARWTPFLLLCLSLLCRARLHTWTASLRAWPRAQRAQHQRARGPLLCSQPEEAAWRAREQDDDIAQDAWLYRKRGGKGFRPHKPKDNRDILLYALTEVSPPPTSLGLFKLEPSAACGDLIQTREGTFVIKKVLYRYAYSGGTYKMVGKSAQVKSTSRDAVDSFMNRMLGSPNSSQVVGNSS